jgi:hypothetical protein
MEAVCSSETMVTIYQPGVYLNSAVCVFTAVKISNKTLILLTVAVRIYKIRSQLSCMIHTHLQVLF